MVEINNLTKMQIDQNLIKKIVKNVLKTEKKTEGKDISVAFVGAERMRKLNKKYRGKDQTTDALAFNENSKFGLGEIVICLQEVKKNSQKNNVPFKEEICRVLIHGLLHLLDYDHEKSEKKAKEMQKKENYFLKKLNIYA